MKSSGDRTLKSLNMKWLVMLAAFDVVVVLAFLAPELVGGAAVTQVAVWRILSAVVLPVVVLLVVNALPHDVKSMLVYWQPRGVVPGTAAFSKYGPADNRIDMAALKKNVGALPDEPKAQNAKWYKLFKLVENEPAVLEAHKLFLMYRDMAVLSLPLIVLVPPALNFAGALAGTAWLAAGLFAVQYILTAVSARFSGIRFVCNVLAEHSARKVAAAKVGDAARKAIA